MKKYTIISCLTLFQLVFTLSAQNNSETPKLIQFSIDLDKTVIKQNDTVQLEAMQFFNNGQPPVNVTSYCNWKVSNPDVVRINKGGQLISIGYGRVSIIAEIGQGKDAQKSTPSNLEVVPKITSIMIEAANGSPIIPLNGWINLKAIGTDINGGKIDLSDSVIWSDQNDRIITHNGGKAMGQFRGTCRINAKYNGVVSDTFYAEVKEDDNILETKVTSNNVYDYKDLIAVGESLWMSVYMPNETDSVTSSRIQWFSSDETIATVDANGKVTGHNSGTIRIHALVDNYLSAQRRFRIVPNLVGVSIPTVNQSVKVGHKIQLISLSNRGGKYYTIQ